MGAGEKLAEEWQQRFRDAATRAYEPCRVYFAALAERRTANLEQRKALVERLSAFLARQAGPDADWRLAVQVLAESRREWRRYSLVDRAAAAPLKERFEAVWAELQAALEAEYARNITARLSLIGRAEALLALTDSRQVVEGMKELQRYWQALGQVPREQDGPLWEQFRRHCDVAFQRREQETAAYVASLEANRDQASALCEQLEGMVNSSGQEPQANARQLEELRSGFAALELPRQVARELQRRFDTAYANGLAAIARQRALDAQRVWLDLLEVGNRVRALALAVALNAGPDDLAALRERVEAAEAAITRWPKGLRALIEGQLAKATAGTLAADAGANQAALRLLCVRAEMLANLASPSEDQPLRQQEQLRRLVQTMGQGLQQEAGQLEALMSEWLSVGPAEEAVYAALAARFARCCLSLASAAGR
jgi:hypothetical protein